MILRFNKNVHLSKLADELLKEGLLSPVRKDGTSAIQGTETEAVIYVPDDTPQETINKIEIIVNTHDPTSPLQPPTEIDYLIDLDYRVSLLELGIGGV